MRNSLAIGALALLLAGGGVMVTGCHEGPAERAGEKMDGNASAVRDKLLPDGKAEEAGKKVDRAVEDATK